MRDLGCSCRRFIPSFAWNIIQVKFSNPREPGRNAKQI
jgi:hypothetical protein